VVDVALTSVMSIVLLKSTIVKKTNLMTLLIYHKSTKEICPIGNGFAGDAT